MKVLMVGAGALGGYFGARLLQAGRDDLPTKKRRYLVQVIREESDLSGSNGCL